MKNLNVNGAGNTGEIDEKRLVELVATELRRREHQKLCMLISNLQESTDANPTLRKAYNINTVNKLFVDVLGIDVQIMRAIRLHRTARGKIPILVIEFRSEADKKKFIKKFEIFKQYQRPIGTLWENTWFSACQTDMQIQEVNRELDRLNNEAEELGQGRPWFKDLAGCPKHRQTRYLVKYSISN